MNYEEKETCETTNFKVSYHTLLGVDTLIGNKVVNKANEELGEINDIMLYVQTGQIVYAILSNGGFLGVGNKLLAIPWHALMWDKLNNVFVLNVAKERIEQAPGFDKLNWPDMADASWQEKVEMYFDMGDEGRPIEEEEEIF